SRFGDQWLLLTRRWYIAASPHRQRSKLMNEQLCSRKRTERLCLSRYSRSLVFPRSSATEKVSEISRVAHQHSTIRKPLSRRSESLQTHRWRGVDSNHRSLEGGPSILTPSAFSSCPPGNRPFMSFVEPDVFHAPAVEDAVDHEGQPLNVRLPTRPAAAVEDDRSSIVLRQLAFDLPNQLLAVLLVCLARLLADQLLYRGITVIVPVELRTASIKQRYGLVGVSRALEVEADAVVLAHHLRKKVGRVDRLEFAVDIDLLQLVDQNHRRVAVVRYIAHRHFDLEMVIGTIAEGLHDLPGFRAVLLHVGIIARQ